MRQTLILLLIVYPFAIAFPWKTSIAEVNTSPKVYLNHFFINVDAATYKDIVTSDFIKNEFANFEERTTVVNNNESYSGAYIYGENTYFEFFDESKAPSSITPRIKSGMAFGVDNTDEIKIIQKKLKEYKNAIFALRTREFKGAQIPWFFSSGVFYGKEAPKIFTWVMEYHEDFLKKWHPDLAPSSPGVTRKDILERYAAKIAEPEMPKIKLLKDVFEMTLRLKQKDMKILQAEMSVYGYNFSKKGNTELCIGPKVRYIIEVIDSGEGKITGIKMRLHHDKYKEATYRFGETSRLILHADNTAAWVF